MTLRSFFVRAAAGAVMVLVVAEVVLVAVDDALPEPVEWYNTTAHAKAVQMDRGAQQGVHKEVAFVGPSTVHRGVIADRFERLDPLGRSAYNAGVMGGYPPVMRRWVTEEVIPRLRPETVVYGLSTLDFHDRIFRGSTEAYRTARATRRDMWGAGERVVARVSRLFKYRRLLDDPTEYTYLGRVVTGRAADRVERELQKLSPGGFESKERVPLRERRATDLAIMRGFEIGSWGTRNVRATVSELHSRGIHVVFLEMPVPDRFVALHPRGAADYRHFRRHLRGLAADLGVDLLRPPRRLSRGYLFADNVHYTEQGARQFTRWLATNVPEA